MADHFNGLGAVLTRVYAFGEELLLVGGEWFAGRVATLEIRPFEDTSAQVNHPTILTLPSGNTNDGSNPCSPKTEAKRSSST